MNLLFRTSVFLFLFLYKVLSLFIYSSFRILGETPHNALQHATKWWYKITTFLFGIKLEVINKEIYDQIDPSKPFFLISNHQSWADIPTIIAATQSYWGFIAKKELGLIPMLNFWMKKAGCILIDRNKFRDSLRKIDSRVKDGSFIPRIALFPEGTRSKTGLVGKFKPGGLKVAWQIKAQIITVAMDGTRQTWETRSKLGAVPVKLQFLKFHSLEEISKETKFNDWVEQIQKEVSEGTTTLKKK